MCLQPTNTYLQRKKYNMSILDRIVSIYAPFCCVDCGVEGDRLFCEACIQNVPEAPSSCYRCRVRTSQYEVCRSCRRQTPLRRVAAAFRYETAAKTLLQRSKYERARRGLTEIAALMHPRLPYFGPDIVLVPVPTATTRVRERGYDQAVVLARELSRLSGYPHRQVLIRLGQAHQVGASRAERLRHLDSAFRVRHPEKIRGAHIVLIDDVCTTGATLESAARTLKQAGARKIDALVFAQPS